MYLHTSTLGSCDFWLGARAREYALRVDVFEYMYIRVPVRYFDTYTFMYLGV